jgi:hypothetical protein
MAGRVGTVRAALARRLEKQPRVLAFPRDHPGAVVAGVGDTGPVTVVSPFLVGRAADLKRLRWYLSALGGGRGGAVIVAGEAGMGKSRRGGSAVGGCRHARGGGVPD